MKRDNRFFLLGLARETIKTKFSGKKFVIDANKIPLELKNHGAVFVTLEINSKLRGCVGHLKPCQPLYQDVIENALSAAFSDPRFLPLTAEEFEKVDIEISVIGKIQIQNYQDESDLLSFISKNKPGVIIEKNSRSATFLPQVLQDLANPTDFLSALCNKAGLNFYDWKNNCKIKTYTVEKFSTKK